MRLLYVALGAPVGVVWLVFFTAQPVPAIIVLLVAVAWRDSYRRRAAFRRLPDEGDGLGPESGCLTRSRDGPEGNHRA